MTQTLISADEFAQKISDRVDPLYVTLDALITAREQDLKCVPQIHDEQQNPASG